MFTDSLCVARYRLEAKDRNEKIEEISKRAIEKYSCPNCNAPKGVPCKTVIETLRSGGR